MYLRVVACEVMVREACQAIATSPHVCDLEFLTQGYHDEVTPGREHLQRLIDATPAGKYDAIVLGYGLCNNLIAGLTAQTTPLVVPRGHDCITFLLGSMSRYNQQFLGSPGTYYYSSGWLECRTRRDDADINQTGGSSTTQYEQMVEKYGEDNAKFLAEALSAWTVHYERGALIQFGFENVPALAARVQEICTQRGWQYELLDGDLRLFRAMVAGDWDPAEFLVVQPGERIEPAWDGRVVQAVAAD
ncbi:MAG: DUF1638 domain-containing protein [Fimbriimonadaceae bacterium]|nr:DUF1638 domain-containing protein [Fimbriimonadaceae bacterium]